MLLPSKQGATGGTYPYFNFGFVCSYRPVYFYYLYTESARLEDHYSKGFFEEEQYLDLRHKVSQRLHQAQLRRQQLLDKYGETIFAQVTQRYSRYRDTSKERMEKLLAEHNNKKLSDYAAYLAECSLTYSGHRALSYLHELGLVNDNLEQDIQAHFDHKPPTQENT